MDQSTSHGEPGIILSLGSINADFEIKVERRPGISETVQGSDFIRLGGGKAANVAFLARKLGVAAQLFGQVGTDELAEQVLASLREIGVDLSGVGRAAGMATGAAIIMVPPDGKKGIVMAANANQAWSEADAARVEQAVREAPPESVLVTDCEIPEFVAERAMCAARQRGIPTVLDPSPASLATDTLIALADVITPNHGEAEALTGIDCEDIQSALQAARRLRERGVSTACVKLRGGGCVLLDGVQHLHIPSVPVDVVDTTGAGDAFAGALAVALLERKSHAEALRFAAAASHLAVTGYGAQPSYPAREDVEKMVANLEFRPVIAGPG